MGLRSSTSRWRVLRMAVVLALVSAAMLIVASGAYAAIGDFKGKWGTFGSGPGQIGGVFYGIAVAPNGDVYLADTQNDRVQYFSATGVYKAQWGTSGSAPGQFDYPFGIAVASNGDVYVADFVNNNIQYFSATGTYKGQWGSAGSGDGQFNNLYSIAVAPNGDVYASDRGNHRIQYFSSTGIFKGKWGSNGSGNGQFNFLGSVAVGPNGDVYVCDADNYRVQYFGPTGTYKGQWGSNGSGNGQFNRPFGVTVSPDGMVFVADSFNHRVQYFTLQGDYLGKWGSLGSGDGQFDRLYSIAVPPKNGAVYVGDTYNYRIQRFAGQVSLQHDAGGVTFQRWVSGKNPAYSGGGYVYSPWAASVLEARFVGTRIKWFGPKQPSYGKAEVFIDGAYKTTIDCYASAADKTTSALLYISPVLTDGVHTIAIAPTGTKNALSTGTAVVVDRFDIEGPNPKAYATRYDDETGTYAGSWVKGTNSAYIAGAYRYSKYPTASYTKMFNGTRVAWIGPKTGNYGRAKVYIDGVLKGTVSQYGTMGWRTKVWESASLPAGNHTLKIVPTGTKDAASKNTIIVIDAIDVR